MEQHIIGRQTNFGKYLLDDNFYACFFIQHKHVTLLLDFQFSYSQTIKNKTHKKRYSVLQKRYSIHQKRSSNHKKRLSMHKIAPQYTKLLYANCLVKSFNFIICSRISSHRLEIMRLVYNEEVPELNTPEAVVPNLLGCHCSPSRLSLTSLIPSRLVPLLTTTLIRFM